MLAIGESDCIVAFGASLNTWTTVRNSLIEGKNVVHVDTNPATAAGSKTPPAIQ